MIIWSIEWKCNNIIIALQTVLISLGLSTRSNEVILKESGRVIPGTHPTLLVTTIGTTIRSIPIIISPKSYAEFESQYSSLLLNQLYPTRPLSAAEKGRPSHKACLTYFYYLVYACRK